MKTAHLSEYSFKANYPDADAARRYIESVRWPKGPICPGCQETKRIAHRREEFYGCNACDLVFTVRTNSIFERSHIPLDKWLLAMNKLMTARKGISSVQLGKDLDITQASAWFLLHRIREACGDDLIALHGTVEMDETYIGGKEKNKHSRDRKHLGRGGIGKTAVVGMRERGGRTKAMPVKSVDGATLQAVICENIEAGSTIHTDEALAYNGLAEVGYPHETVNHGAKEYMRDGVTTNSVESVWAVLKRGVHGIYHHISPKHTARYVNEFTFRLNDGNVRRPRTARLDSLLSATFGKYLSYKRLTA